MFISLSQDSRSGAGAGPQNSPGRRAGSSLPALQSHRAPGTLLLSRQSGPTNADVDIHSNYCAGAVASDGGFGVYVTAAIQWRMPHSSRELLAMTDRAVRSSRSLVVNTTGYQDGQRTAGAQLCRQNRGCGHGSDPAQRRQLPDQCAGRGDLRLVGECANRFHSTVVVNCHATFSQTITDYMPAITLKSRMG